MDSFRWIAVVLSMLLGLGVARLLSSFVVVFRSRSHAGLDWIPLTWAGCIFLWQLQFWWAIIELETIVKQWTLYYFLAMVSLPLTLFLAASLILPNDALGKDDTLTASFERDGRWALAALSAYFVVAFFIDWLFWHYTPLSRNGAELVSLIILPLLSIKTRSRRKREVIAVVYVVLSLWIAHDFSPYSYG